MKDERKATIYDLARLKNRECPKETCEECPLSINKNGRNIYCPTFLRKFTDEANEIILKWCDEHPVKTYAADFYEKFPNAKCAREVCPSLCRNTLYGILESSCGGRRCVECWNSEYKE